jgi:hypothetical protein
MSLNTKFPQGAQIADDILPATVGPACSLKCSMGGFLIASSLRYLLKSRSKKTQSIRLRARRCECLQGYEALSMSLIKATQRTTMIAKPNKVVNNSVPFPIAYPFHSAPLTVSHETSIDLDLGR